MKKFNSGDFYKENFNVVEVEDEIEEEEHFEEDFNQIQKVLNWEVIYEAPYVTQDL